MIAMIVLVGCGDKDPVSSSGAEGEDSPSVIDDGANRIAVGEPSSGDPMMSFVEWSKTDLADDLNEDGVVDNDDFVAFLKGSSAEGGSERMDDPERSGEDVDSSPPIGCGGSIAGDYMSLIEKLRRVGATVEPAGEISQPFFSVDGQVIIVNGEKVQVFEYEDGEAAKREAGVVSSDGFSAGPTTISWVGTPFFFVADRMIVLYVSEKPSLLSMLEEVLGPPFAGGKGDPGLEPDEVVSSPPNPVPGEGEIPEWVGPALFVAGEASEAIYLAQWLNDPRLEARIEEVDFDHNWLIIAFGGRMRSSGYSMAVEDIQYEDETVQVTVRLTTPTPDQMVDQVISYPYDVVVMAKEELPVAMGTVWLMQTVDGVLLTRTRYPYEPADDTGAVSGELPGADQGFSDTEGSATIPVVGVCDGMPVVPDEDSATQDSEVQAEDIRGHITDISEASAQSQEEGIVGSVLIEGLKRDDTSVDKAVVTITEDTRIIEQDGQTSHQVSFASLEMGKKVQALFIGPIRESYPVQATAMSIVILK